jgi:hypothetical protein
VVREEGLLKERAHVVEGAEDGDEEHPRDESVEGTECAG